MNRPDIASIRYSYKMSALNEQDLAVDPIAQFNKWFADVLASEIHEANAMTLCTVDNTQQPHARIVLLKDVQAEGFVFFTNYDSNKGQQIAAQQKVALVFFWKELERQVRIEGIATKIDAAASEQYFRSRPFESQIGAIASAQSTVIKTRQELQDKYDLLLAQHAHSAIPMPAHWGGYIVTPQLVEFWQGRESRLHDRLVYSLHNNEWQVQRLSP
jgi:pyridoxamine 5'-phosphate oxidase